MTCHSKPLTLNCDHTNGESAPQLTVTSQLIRGLKHGIYSYLHPTDILVSAPVVGLVPDSVGFRHRLLMSKSPNAASVKSAPSTFAPSKLVAVSTAFVNTAPFKLEPEKVARSTIAFVKSAPSKLLSVDSEEMES
jgi:hypothetical protein